MKAEQYAYMAGFFDGEGGIYKRDNRRVVRIYQNDPRPLVRIARWLDGGYVYYVPQNGQSVLGIGKQHEVLKFCRAVLPYTIVKRRKVMEAIKAIEARHPEW